MDEEAQKRNTDCVYFLASPLTCKKGNECEYRHSEIARLNPRDCWYWLGGNCLNPHCAFRHPPLEGRPSTSAPGSLSASGISNTLKVPCYYFFQGYCAKGDKCSFMHGPHLGGNPGASAAQKPTKVSSTGTGTERQPQLVEKVATIGSDNGSIKLAPRPSISMEVQLPTKAEDTVRAGSQPSPTKTSQHTPEPALPEAEFMRENALIDTVNFVSKSRVCDSEPTDDWLQDDLETEEWLDESSSGFDVLVDDGCKELGYREDADYLSTNFDMEPGRESTYRREKGICITDELARYDCDHLRVHDQLGYVEAGGWSDHGLCDPYELLAQGHSAYDHVNGHKRKTFDGMASEGTVVSERRGLLREGYSQQSKNVDLRSHLAKRRRVDRRQIADYSRRELHSGFRTCDFQHVHRQWDDEQRHHDVSLRQQQGMRCTKMPLRGRMSWGSGSISRESFHEMELEFEGCLKRVRLRSSPGRHGNGEHFRSRHKEKGRGRVCVETAAPSESSCFRTQSVNKNGTINAMTDFARPKTLEQIKEEKRRAGLLENVCKVADSMAEPKNSIQFGLHGLQGVIQKSQFQPQHNLPDEERKISLGKVVVLESSKIPSFQGPKPLSAILKAKQMSVNDDHVAPGISHELELNGNTETLGIHGKTNALSPGSEENVEVELVQGAKYMFEATTDIQNEDLRPANGPADFRLVNSSIQENGRPVLRSNNRIENIILNEAINGHADDAVVGMEPQKSEDEGKTWEHMWEQDGDEEYLYGDEDDFARRLQGFVS